MKQRTLTGMDEFAILMARILIGGFFAISGANNLLDLSAAVEKASEAGLPAAGLFVFVGAFTKCVLGILIMIDLQAKIAAGALVAYLITTSLMFYGPFRWEEFPLAEPIFYRNLALLGGVLYLYAYSAGAQEMAEYKPKEKRHRERRRRREATK